MQKILQKLYRTNNINYNEILTIINNYDKNLLDEICSMANEQRKKHYENKIFIRGLIEFSNYCKNDCYYCGIRCSNKIHRYRLTNDEILDCCKQGYDIGVRTFVLQGGEDLFYTDDKMVEIIKIIKTNYPDCAITLSMGEKSYESYKKYFDAGADRYLLRHETADNEHYMKLHPKSMSLKNRKECLYNLKEIGYAVGAGFMVGSPYQTNENLATDLMFLKELNPHMVGIGPFIPHHQTIFADKEQGSLEITLLMIALTRLLLPKALIPSTTALGTIDPLGREKGFLVGANVVMINLSPTKVKADYMLYDNKICIEEDSAHCVKCIEQRIKESGFCIDISRGDYAY